MAEGERPKSQLNVDITVSFDELTNIDRENPLGRGAFAVVFKSFLKTRGCLVAYKEFAGLTQFDIGSVEGKR